MTKLNRKIEYSLMALKFIQQRQPSSKVTAKEVADSVHAPFEVIARVLQVMAHKGLLHSEQGASGGYRLNQNLNDVSLFQLVEMIEGPTALVKCISEEGACDIERNCNIVSPIKSLNNKLNSFFKNIPLSELIVERIEDAKHV
jgi:Rrf2 family nitric oxide-sensitive transcriptional repressor